MRSSVIHSVTPFTGVWIEIRDVGATGMESPVTPFTGVWIEMIARGRYRQARSSHPSRVCGLKSPLKISPNKVQQVTPFTGVWIEMTARSDGYGTVCCHTLHGCVD